MIYLSKEQKQTSERRHRQVFNYLKEKFPDCEVTYDGLEGVDHKIIYDGKTVFIETKTCTRIIGAGLKFTDDGKLFRKFRLGRFKFDNRCLYPYKKSQHQDLIDMDGWYIFIVNNRIRGVPAKTVGERLKNNWNIKYVVWDEIIFITYPNWLEQLKKQVYKK